MINFGLSEKNEGLLNHTQTAIRIVFRIMKICKCQLADDCHHIRVFLKDLPTQKKLRRLFFSYSYLKTLMYLRSNHVVYSEVQKNFGIFLATNFYCLLALQILVFNRAKNFFYNQLEKMHSIRSLSTKVIKFLSIVNKKLNKNSELWKKFSLENFSKFISLIWKKIQDLLQFHVNPITICVKSELEDKILDSISLETRRILLKNISSQKSHILQSIYQNLKVRIDTFQHHLLIYEEHMKKVHINIILNKEGWGFPSNLYLFQNPDGIAGCGKYQKICISFQTFFSAGKNKRNFLLKDIASEFQRYLNVLQIHKINFILSDASFTKCQIDLPRINSLIHLKKRNISIYYIPFHVYGLGIQPIPSEENYLIKTAKKPPLIFICSDISSKNLDYIISNIRRSKFTFTITAKNTWIKPAYSTHIYRISNFGIIIFTTNINGHISERTLIFKAVQIKLSKYSSNSSRFLRGIFFYTQQYLIVPLLMSDQNHPNDESYNHVFILSIKSIFEFFKLDLFIIYHKKTVIMCTRVVNYPKSFNSKSKKDEIPNFTNYVIILRPQISDSVQFFNHVFLVALNKPRIVFPLFSIFLDIQILSKTESLQLLCTVSHILKDYQQPKILCFAHISSVFIVSLQKLLLLWRSPDITFKIHSNLWYKNLAGLIRASIIRKWKRVVFLYHENLTITFRYKIYVFVIIFIHLIIFFILVSSKYRSLRKNTTYRFSKDRPCFVAAISTNTFNTYVNNRSGMLKACYCSKRKLTDLLSKKFWSFFYTQSKKHWYNPLPSFLLLDSILKYKSAKKNDRDYEFCKKSIFSNKILQHVKHLCIQSSFFYKKYPASNNKKIFQSQGVKIRKKSWNRHCLSLVYLVFRCEKGDQAIFEMTEYFNYLHFSLNPTALTPYTIYRHMDRIRNLQWRIFTFCAIILYSLTLYKILFKEYFFWLLSVFFIDKIIDPQIISPFRNFKPGSSKNILFSSFIYNIFLRMVLPFSLKSKFFQTPQIYTFTFVNSNNLNMKIDGYGNKQVTRQQINIFDLSLQKSILIRKHYVFIHDEHQKFGLQGGETNPNERKTKRMNTSNPRHIQNSTSNKQPKDSLEKHTIMDKKGNPHLPSISNQITHNSFVSFANDYLNDINTDQYNEIITKNEIITYFNDNSDHWDDIPLQMLLTSALCSTTEFTCDNALERPISLILNQQLDKSVGFLLGFFDNNLILSDSRKKTHKLQTLYSKQTLINNNRKDILYKVIKERALYKVFLSALRSTEAEIYKYYIKRAKNKKRSKTDDLQSIYTLIDKRDRILEACKKQFGLFESRITQIINVFDDKNLDMKESDLDYIDFFL